jgi:hypothetical protein
MYAYGLRINEAITLPLTAVDSKQMVLHVIGKGNKDTPQGCPPRGRRRQGILSLKDRACVLVIGVA